MSDSQRIEGDRCYCHVCKHEWDRANGGLQCPACESEFVEIVEANTEPRAESPPVILPQSRSPQSPLRNPLHDHNPWASDPDESDITTFEFNNGAGRGTFSFTSRTYTFGGGGSTSMNTSRDLATADLNQNFERMLGDIMGFGPHRQSPMTGGFFQAPLGRVDQGFGQTRGHSPPPPPDLLSMLLQTAGQRNGNQPPSAFDILGAMLNPGSGRRGDMVFSQEAFDQIMTQLMEQNNASSAPGPASDAAIGALKKKAADQSMFGDDGKAECSICMDGVELGQEVTVLPCNHWFHGECVVSWLREHDTCPHCRQPITNPGEANRRPSSSRQRRASRRSSSVASPLSSIGEGFDQPIPPISDSPSGLREARQRFYGNPRSSDHGTDRPSSSRRASDRSQRSSDNASGGGGVTGWIRNRLPFSGQQ